MNPKTLNLGKFATVFQSEVIPTEHSMEALAVNDINDLALAWVSRHRDIEVMSAKKRANMNFLLPQPYCGVALCDKKGHPKMNPQSKTRWSNPPPP